MNCINFNLISTFLTDPGIHHFKQLIHHFVRHVLLTYYYALMQHLFYLWNKNVLDIQPDLRIYKTNSHSLNVHEGQ